MVPGTGTYCSNGCLVVLSYGIDMAQSLIPEGLTETLQYASVSEADEHIGNIRSMVRNFGFGRVEEIIENGVPTRVSAKLEFKLKRVKKKP